MYFEQSFNFAKDNKCPICESELDNQDIQYTKRFNAAFCPNGCMKTFYYEEDKGEQLMIYIFDKMYKLIPDEFSNASLKWQKHRTKIINKRIKYWKTNFRYLAEILVHR